MKKPLISVIVCTYNRADLLPRCLESLAAQTAAPELFEVIVVDNNSTDATQEIAWKYVAAHHNFRVVSESAQGLSHARNRGWQEAGGGYVAYIDDDAKAAPDWVERIAAAFRTVRPEPAAVGGRILPWYEATPPAWFTDDLETRSWGDEPGFLQEPAARHGFSGSNMVFPRGLLERFGGFSSEFGMVGGRLRMGEDTEFFMRVYPQEPHFWYDPAIRVYHYVPRRNMRISYRFRRAVTCGASLALMDDRRLLSADGLKKVADLLYLLAKMPLLLAGSIKKLAARVARWLEEVGYILGYLSGKK